MDGYRALMEIMRGGWLVGWSGVTDAHCSGESIILRWVEGCSDILESRFVSVLCPVGVVMTITAFC
jgi:hypothetical protein